MAPKSPKKKSIAESSTEQPAQTNILPVEGQSPAETTSAEAPPEPLPASLPDEHLADLENLKGQVLRLAGEVQTMKVEAARSAAFQKAIAGVKDEVTATRAMLAVPPAPAAGVQYGTNPYPVPAEEECGCAPCECVSPKCCCFDVIMTHFRVVHMQLEPTDTNVAPTNVLELRFFGSIDPINNIGAIIPDPTGWVTGHKGLLEPVGMWVPVYRKIGTKCIPKGTPTPITIELIVIEVEIPIESAVLNRDEYGSASQTVTLDCCYSDYPPIIITVALTGGGLNLAPGVIDAKFSIVKTC